MTMCEACLKPDPIIIPSFFSQGVECLPGQKIGTEAVVQTRLFRKR